MNRYDDREIVNGLPRNCFAQDPSDGSLVMIERGMEGFYPTLSAAGKTAAELNEELGVSPEQAKAMIAGSMFGWGCPAAMACAKKEAQS